MKYKLKFIPKTKAISQKISILYQASERKAAYKIWYLQLLKTASYYYYNGSSMKFVDNSKERAAPEIGQTNMLRIMHIYAYIIYSCVTYACRES